MPKRFLSYYKPHKKLFAPDMLDSLRAALDELCRGWMKSPLFPAVKLPGRAAASSC